MSSDASTIRTWKFCCELAEEVSCRIELVGHGLRLVEVGTCELVGAFQELDELYNYLLGYRDGLAAARESEMLDKMAFEDYE